MRINIDNINKKLLSRLQEGIGISQHPFKDLAQELGLSEEEVITRLNRLREKKILRRIGFSLNTRKLGLSSTLVGCKIPLEKIARAQQVIANYGNITHNYLRKHRLNMWFTLSAVSKKNISEILARLKDELGAEEMVSLPTQKVFKLKFQLHVA